MTLNEYQAEAERTMAQDANSLQLAVYGLGLAGEAGEVVELLKKHLGHGHPANFEAIKKELGDVLWYVSALATAHCLKLSEVAEANAAKLRARYPEGFSSERSINRGDR